MAGSHTLMSPRGDFSEDLEEIRCVVTGFQRFFVSFFLLTINTCDVEELSLIKAGISLEIIS